jgi:hypothetical protein
MDLGVKADKGEGKRKEDNNRRSSSDCVVLFQRTLGATLLRARREVCPELLQQRCSGPQLAAALRDTLSAASDGALHAEELRDALDPRDGLTAGERVARFLGEGPR